MLEEVRITGLGVIDEAVLELSAGFNVSACCSEAARTRPGYGRAPTVRWSKAGCGCSRAARSRARSMSQAATWMTTAAR